MKKIILAVLVTFAVSVNIFASPVTANQAQTVAVNFYKQQSSKTILSVTLADIKMGAIATAYYVFNINDNDGFVIVAADNASIPVLGYNDKGHYDINNLPPNFKSWMKKYVKELDYIEQHNIQATADITTQWNAYTLGVPNVSNNRIMSAVPPLSNVMWGQGWPYNTMCPGGSVTGCVATAMAEIMKYWNYPAHGLLYNSYNENTPQYSNDFGVISRNFYADTYNWSNIPDTGNAYNTDLALLNLDAGISLDMNYDPGGSNAQVIAGDDSVSAQMAYIYFFGYNRHTVRGYYAKNFSNATWLSMMENELNNGRVIQYAGGGDIGHSWVCEGYNNSSQFYMNWGWNTSANGYYALNSLNPYSFNFDSLEEAVIGIQPPAACAAFIANTNSVHTGSTVTFTDESLTPTSITSWQWSFPGGTPSTSTSQNPTVTYNTPGLYNVTLIVTATGGGDTITKNNFIIVQPNNNSLPCSQNFESATFPPAGWYSNNPNCWNTISDSGYGRTWRLLTKAGCGGFGNSNGCMMFNNFDDDWKAYRINQPPWPNPIGGQRQQIYTPAYNFSSETKDYLIFDVAYAPFDGTYSDTLAVYYSLDCGKTWANIYLKGGANLSTAPAISNDTSNMTGFVPTNTQWRTESMQLPASVYGQPSVMFSFENRSGWGGQLYIDNISVTGNLGVNNISADNKVNIYPNPSKGKFTLQETGDRSQNSGVEIYNVIGEKVYASGFVIRNSQFVIDISNQPAGVYLYRILTEKGELITTGKLVIQK